MTDLLQGLNAAQHEAVTSTEGFASVIAGAGSGKTRALTHRFAYLVNELGILPGNILCVTFTNKSVAEMRQRIRRLSGDNDAGYINTFHGFCVPILQEDSYAVQYPKSLRRSRLKLFCSICTTFCSLHRIWDRPQIHGSKFKPDPSGDGGQASVVCITHGVFLLRIRKDPFNGFFSLCINFLPRSVFRMLFTVSRYSCRMWVVNIFCPFSFALQSALEGQLTQFFGRAAVDSFPISACYGASRSYSHS